MYISREFVPELQLADQWVGLDSLGGKTLPKGCPGMFDGLVVQPVSRRIFPKNCYFAIFVKDAIISPQKIAIFRGIKDPENMDGDRLQYRCKYDAFVMPSQCYGAAVACATGSVTPAPAIEVSGGNATITCTDGSAAIYYTLDGSDPRYQGAGVKVYSSPVAAPAGTTVRACAKNSAKFMSAVAEETAK